MPGHVARPGVHWQQRKTAAVSVLQSSVLVLLSLTFGSATPIGQARAGETVAPAAFACRGNEPFWSLSMDGGAATFSRLTGAAEPEKRDLIGRLTALDYLDPRIRVWRGKEAAASGDLVAVITEMRCLDTMSDGEGQSEFAHRVLISLPDGDVLVGCCNAATRTGSAGSEAANRMVALPAKQADDWSRHLIDFPPAMRACLGQTPGPAPRVTVAWAMNHGMIGMRTRNGEGGWFECVAERQGSRVDSLAPLSEGRERMPGEGMPVYSPPAQPPPRGECYEHQQVLGPSGELLGWLSYDTC